MDQLVRPDQLEEPVKRDRLVIVDAAVKTVLQELMELRVLKEHPVYLQWTEGDCCTLHSLQVRCVYSEARAKQTLCQGPWNSIQYSLNHPLRTPLRTPILILNLLFSKKYFLLHVVLITNDDCLIRNISCCCSKQTHSSQFLI